MAAELAFSPQTVVALRVYDRAELEAHLLAVDDECARLRHRIAAITSTVDELARIPVGVAPRRSLNAGEVEARLRQDLRAQQDAARLIGEAAQVEAVRILKEASAEAEAIRSIAKQLAGGWAA